MLTIQVSKTVTVPSDGLDYSYSQNGKRLSLSNLYQLGRSLAAKRLIREQDVQDGNEAIEYCQKTMDRFNIAELHATGQRIAFGNGAFAVHANPHGDWTLNNPTKIVRRAPHCGEAVGHVPSLTAAFELAVDRSFKSSDKTILYAEVNAAYLALAKSLLFDVSVVSDSQSYSKPRNADS
ncbi:MAG TPA: hypothetical protein VGG19_09880 [Tepidisphaeraceae bacterium]|jgi:hypothetical protein